MSESQDSVLKKYQQVWIDAFRMAADHAKALNRIAELEAQLAARPQATGVVVDDAMVDVVCDIAESLMYAAPEVRRSHVLRIMDALTSATLVPLVSAEPVRWMSETGYSMNYQPGAICCVPVYEGIKEVRDGE
jgi:hypothetical protein